MEVGMSIDLRGQFKPCVRCLGKAFRKRPHGTDNRCHTIQCTDCGFNVTATNWPEAVALWNGFKVWTLVAVNR